MLGDFGVRRKGEFEGVSFIPSPVFATKVLGLEGVEDIIKPWDRSNRLIVGVFEVDGVQVELVRILKRNLGSFVPSCKGGDGWRENMGQKSGKI